MAHLLTDEAFALSIAHFQRIGRADDRGYWIGAVVATFIPWNLATLAGVTLGGQIADPSRLGLDVVFPAAMAGLCVGLITGRRELVAAAVGATVGVVVSLAVGTGRRDRRRRVSSARWPACSSRARRPTRRRRSGAPPRPSGTRCRPPARGVRDRTHRRVAGSRDAAGGAGGCREAGGATDPGGDLR